MASGDEYVRIVSPHFLVGTSTAALRGVLDAEDAEALDQALRAAVPALASSGAADLEFGAQAALIQRRAYDLITAGEAPAAAAVMAAAEVLAGSPAEAAAFKQLAPQRLAGALKPPVDGRTEGVIEAALPSASDVDQGLVMVDEIAALAERLGLDPKILPPDGERLLGVLRGIDQIESLSFEQQGILLSEIRSFQTHPSEFWPALRHLYSDRRRAARQVARDGSEAVNESSPSSFETHFNAVMEDPEDGFGFGPNERLNLSIIWHGGEGEREQNRQWLVGALTGEEGPRRDFAFKVLEEGVPRWLNLPDDAWGAFFGHQRQRYQEQTPIDIGTELLSDGRSSLLADLTMQRNELPIPAEIARELFVSISRVPGATDEQIAALNQYIARTVMPLDRTIGNVLLDVVRELDVDPDELNRISPYLAPFLSNEALLALTKEFNAEIFERGWPALPGDPGLAGSIVAFGLSATATAAGVATAEVTLPILGLGALGILPGALDLSSSFDRKNREHNRYILAVEIATRFASGNLDEATISGFQEITSQRAPGQPEIKSQRIRIGDTDSDED